MYKYKSLIAILTITLLAACSSTEDKIVGIWVPMEVNLDTDINTTPAETIQGIVDMQKSVSFEFFADKTMNIVSSDATFPGKWSYQKQSKEIFIKLDGSPAGDSLRMGRYEDGEIIGREKNMYGWMTTVYKKE